MKRLETFTGQHPLRSTNLQWMTEGMQETVAAMLLAPAAAADAYILKGVEVTATSTGVIITEGYAYLRLAGEAYGQVYYVPAGSVSFGSPQSGDTTALVSLAKANAESSLNPVQYGDGSLNDVYVNEVLELRDDTSGDVVLQTLMRWRAEYAGQGMVVDWYSRPGLGVADVLDAGTGLGKGPMLGYAVCDGRNGTPDQRGRWRVTYDERTTDPSNGVWDAEYATLGAVLGEKLHLLTEAESGMVEHSHTYTRTSQGITSSTGGDGQAISGGPDARHTWTTVDTSVAAGADALQAHENRPPSRVFLTFQKL